MWLLSALVSFSLKNRAVVLVATVLFAVLGVRAAMSLPIDAVPDVTGTQVQIITTAPALSPVEMEKYVSIPVERAMAGLPASVEIRSISKYGISLVTVVFKEGTDIYFARQLVTERMREAEASVPKQFGTPEMAPITTALGEIYQFTVENDRLDLMALEELLHWGIAPQLRTVPGVVEVNVFGGENRQYEVELDPARLQAAGVSVAQVVEALERSNANAGAGYLEHNREHFVIGTDGMVKSLDDLRGVVIGATPEGVPITIATVGDARFTPKLRRSIATKDGKGEVVVGLTLMLMGENSRTVTEAVKQKLAVLAPSLPEGTRIEPFYDRSRLVTRTIATVGTNLLEGAALVILVLLLVLGDVRAGLVVAVTIPLSLLFAMTVMNALGQSGNLMSLGAIDFGLLVDGAVIIVENSTRRLGERRAALGRPLDSAERCAVVGDATTEVRTASIFGEAIIFIVYLPLLSLTGVEGKLFRPMATTVLLALAGAFLLSLTLTPVLTSLLVIPRENHGETRLVRLIERAYAAVHARVAKRPGVAVATSVALVVAAAGLFARMGGEFIPQLDEGDVLVEARRLPGAALTESAATDLRIEQALLAVPEVAHAIGRAGSPELAMDPMGLEASDIYIELLPREKWRRGLTKEDLSREISEIVARDVPEIAFGISQPIQMRTNELVAGIKSDVAIILYGSDLDLMRSFGERIGKVVGDVPGAVDVRVQQVAGLRYLRIVPDRAKLARYGLSVEDVNRLTETMSVGHQVGAVLEEERRFDIVVKTAHHFDGDLEPLRRLPLRSVSGQIVPLGDVADLSFVTGPVEVARSNQSRRLVVELNVRDRDLLSTVEDARARIAQEIKLPTGYRIEWGGQFEHYEEARARLYVVVPLALALILFLLWLSFRSTRAALVLFLNVPFAVVGGVFALAARSIPFSISAGVGFVALSGVAVLNGLVLVSFSRQLELKGVPPDEAITRATAMRVRPVIMTALVASLGFVPMALSTAPGAEVQRPLATVVVGGLVSATLLTLFVLPLVYSWVRTRRPRGPSSLAPPPLSEGD